MQTTLENTPLLELHTTIETRQKLVAMKKEIEKQIEVHTDTIKNELSALGEQELQVGAYKVTLQIRDRSTLDKTELISQGVTTDQIKAATKLSTYMQLDVREAK